MQVTTATARDLQSKQHVGRQAKSGNPSHHAIPDCAKARRSPCSVKQAHAIALFGWRFDGFHRQIERLCFDVPIRVGRIRFLKLALPVFIREIMTGVSVISVRVVESRCPSERIQEKAYAALRTFVLTAVKVLDFDL